MYNLSKEDIAELSQEISNRIDFDSSANFVMKNMLQQSPSKKTEIIKVWVEMLQKQMWVKLSIGLIFRKGHLEVILSDSISSSDNDWQSCISEDLKAEISQAVCEEKEIRSSLNKLRSTQYFLLLTPCPGCESASALAVIVNSEEATKQNQLMLRSAAIRASVLIVHLESTEQGYREMATRVAHMATGDIVLAQFRLTSVIEKLKGIEDKTIRQEVADTKDDLERAQKCLDRAGLLGAPWFKDTEKLNLGSFVADIGENLNEPTETTGKKIVNERTLIELREKEPILSVYASRMRLEYALRDLMLGTWLLTDENKPVELRVTNGDGRAKIYIHGDNAKLPSHLSGKKFANYLRDPAKFLPSPDNYSAVHGIGFQLAWKLIEEINGSIDAQLSNGKINFHVELNLSS